MTTAPRVPVLYYHRVSPDADPRTGVTPDQFSDQMAILRTLGFAGTSLDRALSWKDSQEGPTRPPLAITFDDGYEDNYLFAAPILERFGFVATIYFVAGRMGKRVDWTNDPVWAGHRLMEPAMARDLVRRGFEAGSHTLTHPDLAKISDTEARREISESRDRLCQELSTPVTTFCYPYGSYRENHPFMVRDAGYRAARTTRRYRPGGRSDPFRMACRPVSGRMGLPRFTLTLLAYRLGLKGGDVR
ncbi:MAG: polysaccharide deacetylase family protein [Nitrospirae bacterium]|nr:MAG: Polysaccharide deacetylase [Leptospirillum sp. Group IV 'UBA BS']MCL4485718.1 polysaccharide deacetylase family protein [Nitrospirota bacterium]MCL5284943.1 polysaccharide deacetylase family protein [Nitrospirota bacterium]